MNTRSGIDAFVGNRTLAIAGVSRDPKSFSATVYRELKGKGYTLYPVNPNARTIGEDTCYSRIADLPAPVEGVLAFTQPAVTESVVKDAADAGIRRIWIQQGAESSEAVELAKARRMEVVTGECIMMFAEPVKSVHAFHRFVKKLFGGLPK